MQFCAERFKIFLARFTCLLISVIDDFQTTFKKSLSSVRCRCLDKIIDDK